MKIRSALTSILFVGVIFSCSACDVEADYCAEKSADVLNEAKFAIQGDSGVITGDPTAAKICEENDLPYIGNATDKEFDAAFCADSSPVTSGWSKLTKEELHEAGMDHGRGAKYCAKRGLPYKGLDKK
jgi:hypothetical protein